METKPMLNLQKITPFLWFDNNAEEAVEQYIAIFGNSRITDIARYPDTPDGAKGAVMTVAFQLSGQDFIALNGGPQFKFTEAISLFVTCDSQEEVDALWDQLGKDGRYSRCGWLKDRFGLSWQIVPKALGTMLRDPDRKKAGRAMQAMLGMAKIDLRVLQQAFDE
jgi:predicted 3-demethylubiquinone-9 3-methyltransferase (glyoxalase superfamily)